MASPMVTPYQTNVKEQYEELGHFVEAFEGMVREVREMCIFLLAGFDQSLIRFASVALHHQALSAKPLFEILRGIIAEICKDKDARQKYAIDDLARAALAGIFATISKEYTDLSNLRNNLLHGTWFIGYEGPEDEESKEFFVSKMTASKSGLKSIALPTTAAELRTLSQRCEKTSE